MRKVLILTKTDWAEPPRIRHQVTRLLKKKGYAIAFVERNSYRNIVPKKRVEEGMVFYGHSELIHHQLRKYRFIQKANNRVVKYYLKKILRAEAPDIIINFCYDYTFLKALAPEKKIITIINDDFEAQAKLGMEGQIRKQMRDTCRNSDHVLTVSYPLYDKLSAFKNNVTLFFPWSLHRYRKPQKSAERNTVLYWGYVGRMDWPMIENLLQSTPYHYRFIGPPDRAIDEKMVPQLLTKYTNFEHIAYSTFDELDFDDVFCSIIPYNPKKKSVQACTVSNKAFNLLSAGLPLVYADLRYLIKAPKTVLQKNSSLEDYTSSLAYYHRNFYEVQDDIAAFLNEHYEEDRWRLLEKIIES